MSPAAEKGTLPLTVHCSRLSFLACEEQRLQSGPRTVEMAQQGLAGPVTGLKLWLLSKRSYPWGQAECSKAGAASLPLLFNPPLPTQIQSFLPGNSLGHGDSRRCCSGGAPPCTSLAASAPGPVQTSSLPGVSVAVDSPSTCGQDLACASPYSSCKGTADHSDRVVPPFEFNKRKQSHSVSRLLLPICPETSRI